MLPKGAGSAAEMAGMEDLAKVEATTVTGKAMAVQDWAEGWAGG